MAAVTLAIALAGCEREASGPLPQRGYLWQRAWNPAVAAALTEGCRRLDGVIILAAEIHWRGGKPEPLWPNVEWAEVARASKPCSLAVRVAPFAGPFAANDAPARAVVETARTLLQRAAAHGVRPAELQLDFDCADKKLDGYRLWLRGVRAAIKPTRLVITALPSWLNESSLSDLLRETDGYVLQVHSVPTRREAGRTVLCEPDLARRWVAKAARLRRPFSVALPTYRCLAGFDPATGRLLGAAMDSVQPVWPAGTHVLELSADAAALAGLVREWQTARPPELREIIWYRLPVTTDALNWRWPTLAAVSAGRAPERRLEILVSGENPLDIALQNRGESDETLDSAATLRWDGPAPEASDALAGWKLELRPGAATFSPAGAARPRLAPGAKTSLGWLRYEHPTILRPDPIR